MNTNIPDWLEMSAKSFQEQTLERVKDFSLEKLADEALDLDRRQRDFLERECISLYAGTNIMSPRVTRLLGSTLGSRAAEGHPGAKYQTGIHWAEEAEVIAAELIRRVFDAKYAEVRCLSCSMANTAVMNSLTEPGDTIFSLTTPVGGHISHSKIGVAGYRRLDIHDIPYDVQSWEIKLDELRREVKQHPPKLINLGASLILFEYPVREVREIADEVGAYVMYDAAHVAGMIAGGCWQHPLNEGAHVMTASTYKSFGGPPGGIVITNDPQIAKGADRAIFPGMTANFHTNRMAALMVGAAEMLSFGCDYARTCAANAKVLADAFWAEGLAVAGYERGSTDGHMLALDVSKEGMGRAAAQALEQSNIITNFNLLPHDPLKIVRNPSGIRLGVQEITRWGAGTAEMDQIAKFFCQVLIEKSPPEQVRPEVKALKKELDTLQFCFPEN